MNRKKNLINRDRELARAWSIENQVEGSKNPPRRRKPGTISPAFAGQFAKPGAAAEAMKTSKSPS